MFPGVRVVTLAPGTVAKARPLLGDKKDKDLSIVETSPIKGRELFQPPTSQK